MNTCGHVSVRKAVHEAMCRDGTAVARMHGRVLEGARRRRMTMTEHDCMHMGTTVLVTVGMGLCGQSFGVFAAARIMKFFRVLRLFRVMRFFELVSGAHISTHT